MTAKMSEIAVVNDNNSGPHWVAGMWSVGWRPSASGLPLRGCVNSPSRSCPGSGLPQRAWARLSRLCTGVGRFSADVACPRVQPVAAEQTSRQQITSSTVHQMVSMA